MKWLSCVDHPIDQLTTHQAAGGAQVRVAWEYLSHEQDDDGVTVQVLDRLAGAEFTVRSRYLIGADGARSRVAADLDLPMHGEMDVTGSRNITFRADLAAFVGHRPSVRYWVIQPGRRRRDRRRPGADGPAVERRADRVGYDIAGPPPVVDDAATRAMVRNLVGAPDLEVQITGASVWGNDEQYATLLQRGRCSARGSGARAPAVERGGFRHLHPGQLQPGLETRGCPAGHALRLASGEPLPDALIEIWEADDDGLYDVQYGDDRTAARGHLRTDAEGRYRFWALTPTPYPIPADGPVGGLLTATHRSPLRAPHLHFMVRAEGHRRLVTHIFVVDGPLADSVFGVRPSLITAFAAQPVGTPTPDGRELDGPWTRVRFDIVLAPGAPSGTSAS